MVVMNNEYPSTHPAPDWKHYLFELLHAKGIWPHVEVFNLHVQGVLTDKQDEVEYDLDYQYIQ